MNKEQVIDNIKIMIQATVEAKRNYEECLEGFTKELFLDTFTYEDKEILESLKVMMNEIGFSAQNSVSKALSELKKQAHPEVDGVKYYKKYIDKLTIELTEEQKIDLDKCIMKNYHPRIVYGSLASDTIPSRLEHDILKELYELGVIAPAVSMHCPNCGEDTFLCNVVKGKHSIEEYLDLETNQGMDNLKKELSYRDCMECDNEYFDMDYGLEEMVNEAIENIQNPPSFYRFKVIVEPDMTIDNL